ncbi:MAG: tetratricopeptide repeat protein [Candidatus Omnitrophota bacterium]|jgi:4-amino-4-deoxy-L-arabinose transferase-like glycosyltransferase
MKKTSNSLGSRSLPKGGILAGIAILSLLIRLIYIWQLKATPLFNFFAGDSRFYDLFAMKIVEGNFLYKDSVCLNPLYPLFLSAVYFIFGHSIVAAVFLQAILDSLTCLLLYFLSVRVFKNEILGLATAFIYAGYAMAVFYTGFLLDVTLVVFLNVLFVLLVLRAQDKKKPLAWVFAGVVLGLAAVLKASILLFVPLLMFWLLYINGTRAIIRDIALPLGLIIICVSAVLFPFAVKNYLIEKNFSPFPAQGGLNFFIGNNPFARGTYTPFYGIPDSPVDQVKAYARIAEADKDGGPQKEIPQGNSVIAKNASRCGFNKWLHFAANKKSRYWLKKGLYFAVNNKSRYWLKKGLFFAVNNKSRYFRLCLKKLALFFNEEEIHLNVNYYFCKRFIPALNYPLFSFGILAPFAVAGSVLAVRKKVRNAYAVILFVCGHVVFLCLYYMAARYRMPAVPFMIVLGAYGAFGYARLFKRERLKELFLFSLLLGGLFLLAYKPTFPVNSRNDFAVSYNNLGNAYIRENKNDQASREYLNAIRANPGYAQAHYNLGNVYYLKDMFQEAAAEYRETIKLDPANGQAHNNLAVYYFYVEKDVKQARDHANEALKYYATVNPEFLQELFNARGNKNEGGGP